MTDGTVNWFNTTRGFGLIVPDDLSSRCLCALLVYRGLWLPRANRGPARHLRRRARGQGSAHHLGPAPGGDHRIPIAALPTSPSEGNEKSMTTTTDTNRDEETLALRDQGRSFIGIAGILGLDSAQAANAAFNRALRGRTNAQQAWLRRSRGGATRRSRIACPGARRPQRGGGRPSLAGPQAPTQGPLRCLICGKRHLRRTR